MDDKKLMNPKRSSALLAAFFATSLATAAEHPPAKDYHRCDVMFTELEKMVGYTSKSIGEKLKRDSAALLPRLARTVRDKTRATLQSFSGRIYPIRTSDDLTPFKASAWISDSFGTLKPELKEQVDLEQVKASFKEALDAVEKYPERLRAFEDETNTIAARASVLDQAIAQKLAPEEIRVPWPTVKNENGADKITYDEALRYFPNRQAMINERVRLWSQLHARLGEDSAGTGFVSPAAFVDQKEAAKPSSKLLRSWMFPANDTKKFALEQAARVQELSILRKEILSQQSALGKELPEELKGVLDRINALYRDSNAHQLLAKFESPAWATDMLKNQQFGAEAAAAFRRYFPAGKDDQKLNDLITWVSEMPESQKRSLHLDKIAMTLALMAKNRKVQLAGAAGTAWIEGNNAAKHVVDLLTDDSSRKEECAIEGSHESYLDCLVNYIKIKFPLKYSQSIDQFLKGEDVADSEILAELDDLGKRRTSYLQEQKELHAKDQAIRSAGDMRTNDDSKLRVLAVQAASDEDFVKHLLGSESTPSYFEQAFLKTHFEPYRADVAKILATKDEVEQSQLVQVLKQKAEDIGYDLETILNDRSYFKMGAVGGVGVFSGGFNTGGRRTGGNGRGSNGRNGPGFPPEDASGPLPPWLAPGWNNVAPEAPQGGAVPPQQPKDKLATIPRAVPASAVAKANRKISFWEFVHRDDVSTLEYLSRISR